MARQRPPQSREVFLDPRGQDRTLRVTWHHESEVVVLSLWRDNLCAATFRLTADEVPELIAVLRRGLDHSYAAARDRVERAERVADPGPTSEAG